MHLELSLRLSNFIRAETIASIKVRAFRSRQQCFTSETEANLLPTRRQRLHSFFVLAHLKEKSEELH